LQHPGIDQHQHDQQPPQSAIAIQKRVDRLELPMGQGGPHQRRWRRHKAGVSWSGAADPVLAAAELAGQSIGSAAPGQQAGMDLTQEP
jgi:hypothetical protein